MAMQIESPHVAQIGQSAGVLWNYLRENGPTALPKLIKEAELPRDLLMQALGWLAREDKLSIDDEKRTKIVRLR